MCDYIPLNDRAKLLVNYEEGRIILRLFLSIDLLYYLSFFVEYLLSVLLA